MYRLICLFRANGKFLGLIFFKLITIGFCTNGGSYYSEAQLLNRGEYWSTLQKRTKVQNTKKFLGCFPTHNVFFFGNIFVLYSSIGLKASLLSSSNGLNACRRALCNMDLKYWANHLSAQSTKVTCTKSYVKSSPAVDQKKAESSSSSSFFSSHYYWRPI